MHTIVLIPFPAGGKGLIDFNLDAESRGYLRDIKDEQAAYRR